MTSAPPTPRGLRAGGKRLWSAVLDDYDLDDTAAAVLEQACFTVDLLADLRAEVAVSGLKVDSNQGVRVSPFVVELRQTRLLLTKLVAAMGLPRELGDDPDANGGDD